MSKRDRERTALREDDPAAIELVAQRRKADDPNRITHLRERRHETDPRGRRLQIGRERGQHRLVVIERRGSEPGPHRQEQDNRFGRRVCEP